MRVHWHYFILIIAFLPARTVKLNKEKQNPSLTPFYEQNVGSTHLSGTRKLAVLVQGQKPLYTVVSV